MPSLRSWGSWPGNRASAGGGGVDQPAGILRESRVVILSGVRRRQAWRPSWYIVSVPKYLRLNTDSTAVRAAPGSPLRGTSPPGTARPRSSAPCSSPYSLPGSITTATRLSRSRSVQRWPLDSEYSHSDVPSQTNQSGVTCGPYGLTVADQNVRCTVQYSSFYVYDMFIRPTRPCPSVTISHPAQ